MMRLVFGESGAREAGTGDEAGQGALAHFHALTSHTAIDR